MMPDEPTRTADDPSADDRARAARRAQLEAELAALDADSSSQLDATAQAPFPTAPSPDPSVAPGPLATPSDPQPVNPTATSAPAQPGDATAAQQPAPASGYDGPGVGETVAHTYIDPYDNDRETTRYGLVVGTHPADPNVAGSVDRAEIAWLPEGTAVIDVDDLDSL